MLYDLDQVYWQLLFIKRWAIRRINAIYSVGEGEGEQSSQQQQQQEKQSRLQLPRRTPSLQTSTSPLIPRYLTNHPTNRPIIKRRHAVVFNYSQSLSLTGVINEDEIQVSKNEQTNSRILIALKNDVFFRGLSWEQINYFAFIGKVFETRHHNQLLQCAYEPMPRFFIIVSGEVYTTTITNSPNKQQQQLKTFYTGECFCHQSFLYSTASRYSYYARQVGTLMFTLCGEEVKQTMEKYAREREGFYEKVLMNKEEFNYLDTEERDKLIRCFKQRKQIMQGEIVFRADGERDGADQQSRFYVVVRGKFSKCKKSVNGQLMAFKHLREGDYFGQQNLLSLAGVDYTVMCLEDNSELAYFDRNSLESAVDDYGRIIQRGKMQVKHLAG